MDQPDPPPHGDKEWGPITLGSPIPSRCPTPEREYQENLPGQTSTDHVMIDIPTAQDSPQAPPLPVTPQQDAQHPIGNPLKRPAITIESTPTRTTRSPSLATMPSTTLFTVHTKEGQKKRARFGVFTTVDAALEGALDCLLKAANLEEDLEKNRKILDLLQIFREYTEGGILDKAKSILATQVRSLENTSRALANRTRELNKLPAAPPTSIYIPQPPNPILPPANSPKSNYASIAATNCQEWTTIARKNASQTTKTTIPPTGGKKTKPLRQAVLRLVSRPSEISSFAMRNAFNKAFSVVYSKKPTVISAASISEKGNLVLTVTESYSADFLLKNKKIIDSVIPTVSIIENKPWYKVAVHGIPTADLNTFSRE